MMPFLYEMEASHQKDTGIIPTFQEGFFELFSQKLLFIFQVFWAQLFYHLQSEIKKYFIESF